MLNSSHKHVFWYFCLSGSLSTILKHFFWNNPVLLCAFRSIHCLGRHAQLDLEWKRVRPGSGVLRVTRTRDSQSSGGSRCAHGSAERIHLESSASGRGAFCRKVDRAPPADCSVFHSDAVSEDAGFFAISRFLHLIRARIY